MESRSRLPFARQRKELSMLTLTKRDESQRWLELEWCDEAQLTRRVSLEVCPPSEFAPADEAVVLRVSAFTLEHHSTIWINLNFEAAGALLRGLIKHIKPPESVTSPALGQHLDVEA